MHCPSKKTREVAEIYKKRKFNYLTWRLYDFNFKELKWKPMKKFNSKTPVNRFQVNNLQKCNKRCVECNFSCSPPIQLQFYISFSLVFLGQNAILTMTKHKDSSYKSEIYCWEPKIGFTLSYIRQIFAVRHVNNASFSDVIWHTYFGW